MSAWKTPHRHPTPSSQHHGLIDTDLPLAVLASSMLNLLKADFTSRGPNDRPADFAVFATDRISYAFTAAAAPQHTPNAQHMPHPSPHSSDEADRPVQLDRPRLLSLLKAAQPAPPEPAPTDSPVWSWPDEYSGDKTETGNFLRALDGFLLTHPASYSDEERRIALLLSLLRGSAAAWFHIRAQTTDEWKGSWEACRADFVARWADEREALRHEDLWERGIHFGDGVQDYYARFELTRHVLGVGDGTVARDKFVDGLPDYISNDLAINDSASLEDVYAAARELESNLNAWGPPSHIVRPWPEEGWHPPVPTTERNDPPPAPPTAPLVPPPSTGQPASTSQPWRAAALKAADTPPWPQGERDPGGGADLALEHEQHEIWPPHSPSTDDDGGAQWVEMPQPPPGLYGKLTPALRAYCRANGLCFRCRKAGHGTNNCPKYAARV